MGLGQKGCLSTRRELGQYSDRRPRSGFRYIEARFTSLRVM
ncbi:MAG: hypothetical protein ACLT8E_11320 [Akkermansia sp.]